MRHHRKAKFRPDNEYYSREQKLNRKIRDFKNGYYNLPNPSTPAQYREMDMLRREIKYLFSLQESQVWQKSFNRKHAYFSQLSLFKSVYMMWKRDTAFTYIEEYHDVPHHISMWARNIGANWVSTPVFGT